jgi:lysine-N-methylase
VSDDAKAFPHRPQLADHVRARRHLVEGHERVFLHDTRRDTVMEVGPREWQVLAAADGTRDLDGILLAAAREGARVKRENLVDFLAQLGREGLLTGGASTVSAPVDDESDADEDTPAERPLDALADYLFHCDSRGQCCRTYSTVMFSPLEALVARAVLPEVLDGGERHDHVFMPERGSGPCAASAVASVDGACAYLDEDGLCAIHRVAGAEAKPFGCMLYPVQFTDDGERVRVSVAVECSCVLTSVGGSDGAPLVSDALRTRGDLPGAVVVLKVPAEVLVREGERVPRAELVAWTRAVIDTLPWKDPVRALWSLAHTVDTDGLRVRTEGEPELDARVLKPWLRALHHRAQRKLHEHDWTRAQGDITRRAVRGIAATTARLYDDAGALTAALGAHERHAARESFYVRAQLHGYQLTGDPLAVALRDRAVRILVARALEAWVATEAPGEDAFREPLALVEAMVRAHGLSLYVDDLRAASA